ncbi:thiamine/molybdopterin biosynthesis protein MoeB [Spirochaetia bacterium]|nr:thiamine/molybdopterin biosynthesis protein MoeB [Spirochaetia bacterium]
MAAERADTVDRYARQTAFEKIGRTGQEKLLQSRVTILGLGALGTVIAESLCRAGVGRIRLVDRDLVELSNLQRQVLYTEEDARRESPKAVAAAEHLAEINSTVALEPLIADVNAANIEECIAGADLVLDGSDNFELRFLLNEACCKHTIPWIYGGAIAASGSSMNILPGGPCFRCLSPEMPAAGSYPTCSSAGVLNMVTGIVACFEAAEAVKILTGSPDVSRQYLSIDLWGNSVDYITVQKNPECPVCGKGEYGLLGKLSGAHTVSLCGQDAIQVIPGAGTKIDLEEFAAKLEKTGAVRRSPFMLTFNDGKASFNLFSDGRAIIRQMQDPGAAKSIYAEYIGL